MRELIFRIRDGFRSLIHLYFLGQAQKSLEIMDGHLEFQCQYGLYPKNSLIAAQLNLLLVWIDFMIQIATVFYNVKNVKEES
ncbi:MAG: hypothetical protein KAU20_02425 [Nanoarchaeota archaeon]|nr:hypothetical protein [Nanoarchaeota archaeon]